MTRSRNIAARQLLRPTALLVCAALLTPLGCKKGDEEDKAPTPLVYVQAAHPEQGSISEQITGDALLAPLAQAAISPKVTAPVKTFYVQRGAHVHAGQLMAILENKDLAAAALDNKGTYTAAQASYETATKATVPEDLTKAKLELAQAKATLDLDQSIVNARKQLFQQGAIPGRDLDTAQATLVQAQAAYDIAQQHLQSLEKVSNRAAIQNATGTLESARGKYLGAEAQLGYTEIRSPISGVVTDRPLYAGETAAAGTALITVMDTSALIAKLHLAQNQAQQLAIGAPASLKVPGMDDPVPAKVSLISPALDPGSTTVEVWLRVDNRKGALKAGTPVHAAITGRTIQNALKVPATSVLTSQEGNSKYVMVIAGDSTAHKKPVTLGVQNADDVQVLTGISASDMVISTGAYGLDENTKVKIGTDPGAKGDDDNAGGKESGKPDAGDKDKGKDADEK
ncbi:MAG TPA: efflux RND transporter periplasmic adaptor subunit [Acidobacteriaceae bacterium]|jgi:multidrug efflux pump subunit AcrA (membrane-fusion protein)|nr:efflux RND transporter periplasmic adaptor subunit [Acidobacteriaceae bacterium]